MTESEKAVVELMEYQLRDLHGLFIAKFDSSVVHNCSYLRRMKKDIEKVQNSVSILLKPNVN